jgi:hypothetical protein
VRVRGEARRGDDVGDAVQARRERPAGAAHDGGPGSTLPRGDDGGVGTGAVRLVQDGGPGQQQGELRTLHDGISFGEWVLYR